MQDAKITYTFQRLQGFEIQGLPLVARCEIRCKGYSEPVGVKVCRMEQRNPVHSTWPLRAYHEGPSRVLPVWAKGITQKDVLDAYQAFDAANPQQNER